MFEGVPLAQSSGFALFSLVNMITAGIVGLSANRILEVADRGTFAVGMAIIGITAWVAPCGTSISYRRLAAQEGGIRLKLAYVRLVLIVLSPLALLLSAIVASLLLPGRWSLDIVLLVSLAASTSAMTTCFRAAVAHHRTPVAAVQGSLGGSVAMVAGLPFAVLLDAGIQGLLTIHVLGSVVEMGIHAIRLGADDEQAPIPPRAELVGMWRRLLGTGRPDLAYMVAAAALMRGDRLVLSSVAPATVIGVYAAMTAISEIPLLLAQGGGQAVFRSAAANRHDFSTRRLLGVTVAITTVMGICMAVLAGPLILVAAGSSYSGGQTALRLLALTLVPAAAYQLLATVQTARGRSASAALAGVAGFATTAVADIALAPELGAEGAALAANLGYVVAAVAILVQVRRSSPASRPLVTA